MLEANLAFGYSEEMLAARDDVLLLYDIFVRVERQLLWRGHSASTRRSASVS